MLWMVSDNPLGKYSSIICQCLADHNKDNTLQANIETENTLA